MKRSSSLPAIASCCLTLFAMAAQAAFADERIRAKLESLEEHPLALSTPAAGQFRAKVDRRGQTIEYELSYEGFETSVLQAHIHFGRRYQAGGISVFLCTNLGNSPTAPACPTPSGKVSGVIAAANVIGPAGQGIAPGEFAELLDAIEAGATYVNVHSTAFPAGEIRGQIK